MIDNNYTTSFFTNSSFNNITVVNSENDHVLLNTTSDNAYEVYPIRDSLKIVIPLTILYSVILVGGMLGNIITCIVIARNRAMHTATNYYLFSLAVSDLLLLISGMPLEIYGNWYRYPFPFGESVCIMQGFAAETSANATVLTITAFTAERYIAICHPFLSHTMSKLSRAIKFILGIWVLAMCLAVPQILDLGLTKPYDTCGIKNDLRKHVFTISSIICFVFPMTVITVFYVLIGLQLRRSKIVGRATTANGNSIKLKTKYRVPSQRNILLTIDRTGKANTVLSPVPSHSLMEAVYSANKHEIGQRLPNNSCDEGRKNYSQKGCMGTRHVVNMLVAVVVAFFVCWAPHHAQRLFAMNAGNQYGEIYEILTHISGVLYFFSTCINPVLYNIMSYKFREAFKGTCVFCIHGRGHLPGSQKGALSRNISQRSNSHSAHTCSSICSTNVQQSNSCLLDQDLTLLKCTKRPLTVKFKKTLRQSNLSQPSSDPGGLDYNNSVLHQHSLDTYQYKSTQYQTESIDPKRLYNAMHNATTINSNKELESDLIFTMTDYKYDFNEISPRTSRFLESEYSDKTKTLCYSGKKDTTANGYNSPYDSPELTVNSRKLEESLQNILKDLVKTDNTNFNFNSCHGTNNSEGLSKSKSVSNLLAVRTKRCNKLRKSFGSKEPI